MIPSRSAGLLILLALSPLAGCVGGGAHERASPGGRGDRAIEPYVARIDVRPSNGQAPRTAVSGVVFEDLNRDGLRQEREPGIAGVLVSNGRAVTRTSGEGRYELPVEDDMSVFVSRPAGYRTPTDANWVPQFAYQHKPAGSPVKLRFGGLEPTGPLPAAINFPMVRAPRSDRFACAVIGDSQTYSNREVGYFRDSTIADIMDADVEGLECLIFVGDVVGDDLGLLPRILEVTGLIGVPIHLVHGNHDYDYDAKSDKDSADSWRRLYGPNYYSFEIGEVLFVQLDNVVYPCDAEDMTRPGREFCADPERPTYNGRVDARQMEWLRNTIEATPRDKLIVLSHHIPFVSFVDATTTKHQTDNLLEIYALLEGRKALSLAGHTHTTENLAPGEHFGGWREAVGVTELPFRHIIAGAASGAWWTGDLAVDGVPMALQRQGAPKGYMILDFDGVDYAETYYGAGLDEEARMWVSLSTPGFRAWFDALDAWRREDEATRDPTPPVNVNDLPDTRILTPADLAAGVDLAANVWNGDRDTRVVMSLDDGAPTALVRTQEGDGEAARVGSRYADPFAAVRQLQVARFAFQSRSGDADAQGWSAFRGRRFGPAAPQPQGAVADRSMHLWTVRLPEDLEPGAHRVVVEITDRHGRKAADSLVFEVRAERPEPDWRAELWAERPN